MPPSPPPLLDEVETQRAIRSLALEISEAVAKADINRVCQLSNARQDLLRKACGPEGCVHFTDNQRAELIHESEAWIASLNAHQERLAAEIEHLRALRNTKRILTRTYHAAPATAAQCFTQRG